MKLLDSRGFIPLRLEALTPVHIGSGEDFSPLEYVVRQVDEARHEVWLIDTQGWLADSRDDRRVASALEAGDMAALRGLLNSSPGLENRKLGVVPVTDANLGKMLQQKRNTVESRAEIMTFARNPFTHLPYVPASSIKGAISTALTDCLNGRRKGRPSLRQATNSREYSDILEDMYGAIGSHAMQALRMTDMALLPGSTSIVSAIRVNLGNSGRAANAPCEALNPGRVNALGAYGNMRIASRSGAVIVLRDGSRLSLADIRRICNEFYLERFKAELARFYSDGIHSGVGANLKPVCDRLDALDEDREFLLRLGRYSHIECVTVGGKLPPTPNGGPGKSRTLADGSLPFGWAIVKQCGLEEYENAMAAADLAFADAAAAIDVRGAKARQEREKQLEAEARKRREAEAAQEREKALAALSPEERAVYALEQPEATENQASDIYARLDQLGDLRSRAAEALMKFWQRIGKWEGKNLTKKQKEKVVAVRNILRQ